LLFVEGVVMFFALDLLLSELSGGSLDELLPLLSLPRLKGKGTKRWPEFHPAFEEDAVRNLAQPVHSDVFELLCVRLGDRYIESVIEFRVVLGDPNPLPVRQLA
jgi:hypothetical protein